MALQKQPVSINFAQGLDTKTDPYQVPIGKFEALVNSVFTKAGLLTKCNGFAALPSLPTNEPQMADTFNGGLLAIGSSLQSYSADTRQWIDKGPLQPIELSVVPQVRTNTTQLTVDTSVASNGLSCTTWYDSNTNSYYRITDSASGQVIVDTTQLTASPSATVGPKVFALGNFFVIVYWQTITAVPTLRYIAIPINNPIAPGAPVTIIAGHGITDPFDGFVSPTSGRLYLSFRSAAAVITTIYLTSTLARSSGKPISTTPSLISTTTDTNGNVWVTWYDTVASTFKTAIYDSNLNVVRAATAITTPSATYSRLTSVAKNGILTIFYETAHVYVYTPNSPGTPSGRSNFVSSVTYNNNTSTEGATTIILRSVGIASKAFYIESTGGIYLLVFYGGLMQPTYFLIDSTGNIISKLAYGNGAGYSNDSSLPAANVNGNIVQIGYRFKALTTPVNKGTDLPANSQVAGIYNQIAINLAAFDFGAGSRMSTAELAGSLQFTGGFMWQYDGVKPVEQGFHLYPEDLGLSPSVTSGDMTAQQYYYVACYEWTDAVGNIHRSAPSVPVTLTLSTATAIEVNVPTLRLTYKTAPNIVRIVIYRWSVAQQVYYQLTSITSPVANSTTTDSILYIDSAADSAILGNTILYTNGGVVENIAAPAISAVTPFNTRLFAISSEDPNLLVYSKQVIESTPVEMSDLFTLYVAPTISATGSTGPMKCLSALDDKLIVFKKNAIYYITGVGPDNAGNQNDFSAPTFITSTVGCANQKSIVFMPNGLMFQSDKGIWLLGRDLSTKYIGAPVEEFNQYAVLAANNIPGTNQVRFRLSNGVTLMYDYYFDQWGSFQGIKGISSTIYQDLETVITSAQMVTPSNQTSYTVPPSVFQETPGVYLNGTDPVLMSFKTGWISLADLQGYERFYQLLFLGNYISPFKLNTSFAYDFNPSIVQTTPATPEAPGVNYGLAPGPYGSGVYGGPATAFKARVFPTTQKCDSFQVSVQETYDPQYDIAAGAGLTLSGMQLLIGVKKGTRVSSAARSFG